MPGPDRQCEIWSSEWRTNERNETKIIRNLWNKKLSVFVSFFVSFSGKRSNFSQSSDILSYFSYAYVIDSLCTGYGFTAFFLFNLFVQRCTFFLSRCSSCCHFNTQSAYAAQLPSNWRNDKAFCVRDRKEAKKKNARYLARVRLNRTQNNRSEK